MTNQFIAYPFTLGPHLAPTGVQAHREGISQLSDPDKHLQNKILAILFTAPGERVMNPGFGAGLNRSLFENLSPVSRSANEYKIRESLERDLGSEMILEDVEVAFNTQEGAVVITIDYSRRKDRVANRFEIIL